MTHNGRKIIPVNTFLRDAQTMINENCLLIWFQLVLEYLKCVEESHRCPNENIYNTLAD